MKIPSIFRLLCVCSLLTFTNGCYEEPTAGDRIEDVGEGIGDAVDNVVEEIEEIDEPEID
jgi:hypothetical protein